MQFNDFSFPALLLLITTSIMLLVGRDWRLIASTLGVQYVGVFVLVGLTWPLEMAVVKLVVGWIAASVLGMEMVSLSSEEISEDNIGLSGKFFRIFLAVLVGLAILSIAPELAKWLLNASYDQILGSLILIGMGILHLGVSDRPFCVAVGILTFLSGFEIIYATVETSSVVAGFLAFFSLGIALIGSYFSAVPSLESDQ